MNLRNADGTYKEGLFHYRGMVIPKYMREGLERYIQKHEAPGSFLQAVITNDLTNAVGIADEENIFCIPAYVNFLYNYAPTECWGNEENFYNWLEAKEETL